LSKLVLLAQLNRQCTDLDTDPGGILCSNRAREDEHDNCKKTGDRSRKWPSHVPPTHRAPPSPLTSAAFLPASRRSVGVFLHLRHRHDLDNLDPPTWHHLQVRMSLPKELRRCVVWLRLDD